MTQAIMLINNVYDFIINCQNFFLSHYLYLNFKLYRSLSYPLHPLAISLITLTLHFVCNLIVPIVLLVPYAKSATKSTRRFSHSQRKMLLRSQWKIQFKWAIIIIDKCFYYILCASVRIWNIEGIIKAQFPLHYFL